ncbi:RidA family protein [Fulvivirga sedimenti]|uniref:RidA family protein n=1 Tax=Fulvivirga sedimenti TaxID=2879465 RepID=A0A9X1L167_9BACT|nr:RidA family protein [Fulvivirga sedimenti]MCA6075429.1 RidA family protein [Fulvivirga sedimenti]MCA6076606.1 RidA family protein [Fulvivirga sedimenti]MCA6077734.1 RidA family protein [Fulvivirga sedimenti]
MKRFYLILGLILFSFPVLSQSPEDRLEDLGITLPEVSKPVANYVKYVRTGNLIFLAGHGPCGGEFKRGKVGQDLTVEEGYDAARLAGVCVLATLKDAIGDLSKVKRVVRVLGMVNATDDFTDHSKVINGFSDLMTEVFGESGKHARAAVGMASLPTNIPVEVEMIVEIAE